MSDFQERGSSWALTRILYIKIGLTCYDPLRGSSGSFVPLPKSLIPKRHTLINVENEDNRCFLWCLMAHLFPTDISPHLTSSYPKEKMITMFNLKGIEFPLKLIDIPLFEKLNPNFSINVYGFKSRLKKVNGPLYLSNNTKFLHKVNLLYIRKIGSHNGHYVYIKSLSPLIRSQITKHTRKLYTCHCCIKHFQHKNL